MTFRQAEELGGHVRKGETGSLVVYAGRIRKAGEDRTDEDTLTGDTGAVEDDKAREIPFLKGYTVFNVEQIDGLPERYATSPAPVARIETAERFLLNCGATVGHGGDRAWYSPAADCIQLPRFASFRDAESYYATYAHELTHWTGHPSRLDRALAQKQDRDGYAREELVAELGSAFLSADLGLTPEPRADHAAYLSHWLTILKADKRAIFRAAADAQRAADFLHGLQPRDCEH